MSKAEKRSRNNTTDVYTTTDFKRTSKREKFAIRTKKGTNLWNRLSPEKAVVVMPEIKQNQRRSALTPSSPAWYDSYTRNTNS